MNATGGPDSSAFTHQIVTPRPAVPLIFDGDDAGVVICVAPGPSLTYGDLRTVAQLQRQVPGLVTVTINGAYQHLQESTFRYAADGYWWNERPQACDPAKYAGGCFCLEYGAPPRVQKLDYNSSIVLSEDRHVLATGGHSGYSAINFAYLLGAKTIVLLGYDMQPHPTTGVHHFQGDEPGQRHLRYHLWLSRYAPLRAALEARGCALLNCTRHTAIPAADVPRGELNELL